MAATDGSFLLPVSFWHIMPCSAHPQWTSIQKSGNACLNYCKLTNFPSLLSGRCFNSAIFCEMSGPSSIKFGEDIAQSLALPLFVLDFWYVVCFKVRLTQRQLGLKNEVNGWSVCLNFCVLPLTQPPDILVAGVCLVGWENRGLVVKKHSSTTRPSTSYWEFKNGSIKRHVAHNKYCYCVALTTIWSACKRTSLDVRIRFWVLVLYTESPLFKQPWYTLTYVSCPNLPAYNVISINWYLCFQKQKVSK